jgi:hypothetical protein
MLMNIDIIPLNIVIDGWLLMKDECSLMIKRLNTMKPDVVGQTSR